MSGTVRIGVTGHQEVDDHLAGRLEVLIPGLAGESACGIGCLASGADQLFAETMLGLGHEIETILPCAGYEDLGETAADRTKLHRLLDASRLVTRLPFPQPSEEAYLAAGLIVVERCDVLIAAWDGQRARGLGGTADVVDYARATGRDVRVVPVTR